MNRGEIWHCDLSPAAGREQQGNHSVLIISPASFNRGGVPLVCPITAVASSARMRGFAVNLQGAETGVTGVIQCDQIRALDMIAHKGRNSGDQVPASIMQDVLARIALIAQCPVAAYSACGSSEPSHGPHGVAGKVTLPVRCKPSA